MDDAFLREGEYTPMPDQACMLRGGGIKHYLENKDEDQENYERSKRPQDVSGG